ncbi:MAG: hypothetical protein P8171_20785 [Candidatus Thiodiazotropha sp.]
MDSTHVLTHIDRKIAFVFGGLIFVILLAVFSVVGLYYQHVVERGEDELTSMVTQVLGDSINRISFSGKYHARLMVEEVAASQPQIVYIMIIDKDGRVMAHSDPDMNGKILHDPAMRLAGKVLQGQKRVIQERVYHGIHIKDVAIPYRGGYRDELLGVIRVGITKEKTLQSLSRGWLYLLGLVVLLLALAVILSTRISTRFGRPIKRLAWELQGILEHAPLLIYGWTNLCLPTFRRTSMRHWRPLPKAVWCMTWCGCAGMRKSIFTCAPSSRSRGIVTATQWMCV